MLTLTLQQLFGFNARQTETEIRIVKADLAKLTPQASNSAESLLVALVLLWHQNFQGILTDEKDKPILANNMPLTYDNSQVYEQLNIFFWRRQFIEGKVKDSFIVEIFITIQANNGNK